MNECTFDVETTYGSYLGRKGSPFSDGSVKLCASEFLFGEDDVQSTYLVHDSEGVREGVSRWSAEWLASFPDLSACNMLIGHNIKFDLLWYWRHPALEEFLANGGRIWDTAYAEYLLSGQVYNLAQPEWLRPSLKYSCKRRKLEHQKLDMVAALWEQGVRTEDINQDVLMDYLHGDVKSTHGLYVDQVAQAIRQNQLHMIQGRMEGLLATTEMEFNGLCIDIATAEQQQAELEEECEELEKSLYKYIPELPPELEFNWASSQHLSALIFGGTIKYQKQAPSLDADGNEQYYQKKVRVPVLDKDGNEQVYKSGKNAGKIKTRLETCLDLERGCKTKLTDFFVDIQGYTKPHHKWRTKNEGVYSTGAKVLAKLAERSEDLPLIKELLLLRKKRKDLGTYYKRFYKGKWTGMLTKVGPDNIVHHTINETMTLTTRLSSSNPNLQNIPKGDEDDPEASKIKKVFFSRFGEDGRMGEADYSQLEVVCKGVLSRDEALLQALIDKVCFHCDWLSLSPAGEGLPYEEVFRLCKIDKDPKWVVKRSKIKPLTFGEAYGAGIKSLSESTGMDPDALTETINNRKQKYKNLYKYDDDNIAKVNASRRLSTFTTMLGVRAGIGYLRTDTDTIFHFVEEDAPDWLRHKGTMTSFKPTTIKNYPSQGLGGEIMHVTAGRLFRWILKNKRFDDNVLLVNTVHDCCWFDYRKEYEHVLAEAKAIMEDVCAYFNENYPNVNWNTPFPVELEVGPNLHDLGHYQYES